MSARHQQANCRLRRQGHPGPGGPRPGPQAARHVHRVHRSGGSPPPHLGGRRQLRRRGDGRLLHAHRRHAAGRRRLPRRRQRSRHPGRSVPLRPAQGQERGRGRAHRAARRRQVRRRGLQGLRRPARRRRQRGQRAQRAPGHRGRQGRQALPPGVRQGRQAAGQARRRRRHPGARPHGSGTTVTFWPDPTVFARRGHRVRGPHRARAAADDGVPQQGPRDRLPRRASRDASRSVTYQYKGGIVDFVKHLNASKEALFTKVAHFEDEDDDGGQTLDIAIQWNTGYYEGIHGYANGISTIEGGMHVEGFKTALTSVVNKYARAKNLLKEKDENLLGEDIREGITAIVSVKLRDPQFEGQTKAKLGNVPMRSLRAEGHQRDVSPSGSKRTPPRPTRSSRRRRRPRRPASPPRTPATPSAARRRSPAPACPTS